MPDTTTRAIDRPFDMPWMVREVLCMITHMSAFYLYGSFPSIHGKTNWPAEREALSPDEKRQWEDDLLGTRRGDDNDGPAPLMNDTDKPQEQLLQLQRMQEALELIPKDQTQAYLHALEQAPELVDQESTPRYF